MEIKKYRDIQTRLSKMIKENSTYKLVDMAQNKLNNQMQRKIMFE